jgi:hypothetical protein
VRLAGTPRVTVLVGGDCARALWHEWLSVTALAGTLLDGQLATAMADAVARAAADPTAPIAVLCSPDDLRAWRAGRRDRLVAMVDEGAIAIPDDELPGRAALAEPAGSAAAQGGMAAAQEPTVGSAAVARSRPRASSSPAAGSPQAPCYTAGARSAAEAALFEALEGTPSTAGRFELNGRLAVRFGAGAIEVDVLARRDHIAIEIDGYRHFDLDAYRRDRRKDLLLQTYGYLVIRVLAHDVMQDARPAVNAVCQALAHRRSNFRPQS